MQVRPGDAPGGADLPEERAGLDHIAYGDSDGGKMSVKGVQAQAVVQHDSISREE